MGKIAAIAMVKDECDIIELFVKINSRSFEHIYIIDHNSQDGTLDILLTLKAHGFPLTIYRHESMDFQQAVLLTTLARQLAATDTYDFIVPLDADEFLSVDQARLHDIFSSEIPAGNCGTLRWVTFAPLSADYYQHAAPLHELFRQRRHETHQRYKVVIPNAVARQGVIAEGNHFVRPSPEAPWLQGPVLSVPLQHAPIRSLEQITAKALIGSMTLSIKRGRTHNEGAHWDDIARQLTDNGYRLTHEHMLKLVDLYAGASPSDQPEELYDLDAPRIGLPSDRIELSDLSRINLTRKLHQFATRLCKDIRQAQATPA